MSGAEAIAVIGIISNILQLVEFSSKVYDRVKDFTDEAHDIPKAFRESRNKLELVSASLSKTKARASMGHFNEDTCKALRPALERCQSKLAELRIVFEKVVPADGASKMTRRWKAMSSLRQDKKVKALMMSIWDDVQLLTSYHVTGNATDVQVASIAKEISTVAEAISGMTTSATALKKPCFTVPYQKDKDFVARQDILEEIEQRFRVDDRVAIAGIGGVGYDPFLCGLLD